MRIEKLSREEKLTFIFDLVNAFGSIKKSTEAALFLQDLLTADEIRNLAIRLQIAKLLLAGKSFREIKKEVHTSFVTITKVNLWLEQGGEGFKKIIARLPARYSLPRKLPPRPIEFHLPELLLYAGNYALAKRQEGKIEDFIQKAQGKKVMDRSLQEAVDTHYRRQAFEKGRKTFT